MVALLSCPQSTFQHCKQTQAASQGLSVLKTWCVQATGSVRFLQRNAIAQQLELGHIVLLTSLAYSASGVHCLSS